MFDFCKRLLKILLEFYVKKASEVFKAVSTGILVLCACVSEDSLKKQLASILSYLLIGRLLVFEKSSPEYHPIQFPVA